MLSVSEACNNAIEHAYRGEPGTIRLLLEHRAARSRSRSRITAAGARPTPSSERGRGLQIMRAVMARRQIEHAPAARA